MSSYFIAQITIDDQDEYDRYLAGFDEILAGYKGEVVVVDDQPRILEGTWSYTRVVLIRFSSETEAMRWYVSSEYQSLAQHRFRAAYSDVILAAGRD